MTIKKATKQTLNKGILNGLKGIKQAPKKSVGAIKKVKSGGVISKPAIKKVAPQPKSKVAPVEVICIVDRSGSMQHLHDDVIGGINSFIAEQKKVKGKANLTLVEFDSEYNVIQKREDLKKAKPVTKENFVPRGATALNDAIGKTVVEFDALKKAKKINKAIFCIMTDGYENASETEFRDTSILKALLERVQKDYKWEFVYLGANQDAVTTGVTMGFAPSASVNYAATSKGVSGALRSFNATATNYRSSN